MRPADSIVRRGLLALSLVGLLAGCSTPRDVIIVDEGIVTVENQTDQEWRSVRVTVNDHFTGGAPSLPAGSRLTAQLSQFQTGLGQKFDRRRQSVVKIEVTATSADGKPVALKWGADQPK
jgi:hypothetical protein